MITICSKYVYSLITLVLLRNNAFVASQIVADNDIENALDEKECQAHFNGTLNSCNTFKIATLDASPRRCLHIESWKKAESTEKVMGCLNYPKWFDGTNDCEGYGKPDRADFCKLYGNWKYSSTPYTANEACCACGGGNREELKFHVGDNVIVPELSDGQGCKKLRVAEVQENYDSHYTVEVLEECGSRRRGRGGKISYSIKAGSRLQGANKKSSPIRRDVKLELRKCRDGVLQQEFTIQVDDTEDGDLHQPEGSLNFHIEHYSTLLPLSLEFKDGSPVTIQRAFNEGDFEGSDVFFYINDSTKNLISGQFGQPEYANAEWQFDTNGYTKELQSSMWTFVKVDHEGASSTPQDNHADWLQKIAESIGIEYVQKNFAPWHILDVDREAAKSDVKSRFRELSRRFHPDKNKSEIAGHIFVALQLAYDGLKDSDEKKKAEFRAAADSESQLFSHSRHVTELLPFHWKQVGNGTDTRYVIDVASTLNSTTGENITNDGEHSLSPNETQLWVLQLYSARCGMTRSTDGFLDLAARHLKKHENIKVAAYGCGLYNDDLPDDDVLGLTTDPICKQFGRRETPNLHVVVETLSGDDEKTLISNAKFDYFYAAVPAGNSTQLYPGPLIDFAVNGKKVWDNYHLVEEMTKEDFDDPLFLNNTSIVAFIDRNNDDLKEVQDALTTTLPALAARFKDADVYVGVAACGAGEEEDEYNVDCSKLNVSWLPDVKIFAPGKADGLSLVRDDFTDRRDVQVAIESLTNTLAALYNLDDEDRPEDQFEDTVDDEQGGDENSGECFSFDFDFETETDLDEIDKPQDKPELEAPEIPDLNNDADQDDIPELEKPEEKPQLVAPKDKPKLDNRDAPKLAEDSNKPKLSSRGESRQRTGRIDARRPAQRQGSGTVMSGGGGGSAGAIAG